LTLGVASADKIDSVKPVIQVSEPGSDKTAESTNGKRAREEAADSEPPAKKVDTKAEA
jgi:hypothetical protein